MHRITRILGVTISVAVLSSCLAPEETIAPGNTPLNDEPTLAPTGTVLGDDGLIAPSSPTLSIGAAPGTLNFAWRDNHNSPTTKTEVKLYEYNYRTEQEVAVGASIASGSTQFNLPITPHRIAWDASSYRVEICAHDDCLSSQRIPISELLSNAVTAVTPSNTELSPSFGDDIALNATGNVAVVSSPLQSSAAVLFHLDSQWVQASTLTSTNFSSAAGANMRVSSSASGDTLAIATISKRTNPVVVIFDRLGENWIETATIAAFQTNTANQEWDTSSMSVQLSDNGDRLVFGAKPAFNSINSLSNANNDLHVFDRRSITWTRSARLSIPAQHSRLQSMSASGSIDTVFALSALNGGLFLHEFSFNGATWGGSALQFLDTVTPSLDTKLVANTRGHSISLAAWEPNNGGGLAAVAWKLEKRNGGWIVRDSIRLPPMNDSTASLRLAADAELNSVAVGWQANTSADIAFYEQTNERWVHLFSVPGGFNLNRTVPLAQSVKLSADNSTALIGTTNTGNGGLISSLR